MVAHERALGTAATEAAAGAATAVTKVRNGVRAAYIDRTTYR
jgi:hypothetical protein